MMVKLHFINKLFRCICTKNYTEKYGGSYTTWKKCSLLFLALCNFVSGTFTLVSGTLQFRFCYSYFLFLRVSLFICVTLIFLYFKNPKFWNFPKIRIPKFQNFRNLDFRKFWNFQNPDFGKFRNFGYLRNRVWKQKSASGNGKLVPETKITFASRISLKITFAPRIRVRSHLRQNVGDWPFWCKFVPQILIQLIAHTNSRQNAGYGPSWREFAPKCKISYFMRKIKIRPRIFKNWLFFGANS